MACAMQAAAGPFSELDEGLHYTTNLFIGWISSVGTFDRPNPDSGGYVAADDGTFFNTTNALRGIPSPFLTTTKHVCSLGNGGSIIVTFDRPIVDGGGPDFAVFENGFEDTTDFYGTPREGSTNLYLFAELAFVDVGSTTSHWARFPVTYLNTQYVYEAFDGGDPNRFQSMDVTFIDGLAGKHAGAYGTPFDLSVLQSHSNVLNGRVDLNNINYIRITDVVGDGSLTDKDGRPIYDPYYDKSAGYPTPAEPFGTQGFDLRAIAVCHTPRASAATHNGKPGISFYAGAGNTYRVQWCDNLQQSQWQTMTNVIIGDATTHTITDTDPSFTGRYYRIVREVMP